MDNQYLYSTTQTFQTGQAHFEAPIKALKSAYGTT